MNSTLLIVDDDPGGREALESLLMNQDYKLICATNGVEALDKAREDNPDLILLDVMMPGMDGFEVCRRLRDDPLLAEVPVLMVTALDDRDSLLQGIEAGADDFITKPIDRAVLRTRVRAVTRLNRYRRLQEERSKLERQLERLTALRTIDLAITSSLDLRLTLEVVLEQVTTQLNVNAADILLLNGQSHYLGFAAGHGFHGREVEKTFIRLGEGYAGCAALERRTIGVPDLCPESSDFGRPGLLRSEHFCSYYVSPLIAKGQVVGVLEVFHRALIEIDPTWLDFLEALGQQAAIAIENARLFAELTRTNSELIMAYEATIEGWSHALDLRDKETEGHTRRVTEMAVQLSRAMGMRETELVHVRRGALLHDIGKLSVPDSILLKPGPLIEDEWVVMRKHPAYAYELLSPIAYLRPALDIPYAHHEKWDGKGYPRGLKGDEIPFAALIFAVVDVWDALTSTRPYRPAFTPEQALEYILEQRGKHFNPDVVDEFIRLFLQTQAQLLDSSLYPAPRQL